VVDVLCNVSGVTKVFMNRYLLVIYGCIGTVDGNLAADCDQKLRAQFFNLGIKGVTEIDQIIELFLITNVHLSSTRSIMNARTFCQ
jgi:hypothetical protein